MPTIDRVTKAQVDVSELQRVLLGARNADGGWGYYTGKTSRLEPTCWGVIALPAADPVILRRWPVSGDLLVERPGGDVNYGFHAIALLTLLARGVEHDIGNARLLRGLQQAKGTSLDSSVVNRQDNSLQGWSWIPETFSWVEPTAWSLLTLEKWSRVSGASVDATRVKHAQALLIDRCCKDGGWNYGNANMLGQDLRPYVPTTAIALLAMASRRSEPAVERSVAYLERAASTESSGVALSLAAIALRAHGRPDAAPRAALLAQLPTSMALGNHLSLAMALCALASDHRDAAIVL
jgi:hypothetical protein